MLRLRRLPYLIRELQATEVLNDNCGHYTFTVPEIAPGQYLMRAEVIGKSIISVKFTDQQTDVSTSALHVASTVGGAQFYMSCYQLNVGGSGTAEPSTVQIPGAYQATDPGILIDIYTSPTAYTSKRCISSITFLF